MYFSRAYILLAISLCFLLPCFMMAQLPDHVLPDPETDKIYFRKMTREEGLPSNVVRWIENDFRGYLWIGTDNGLVRYDGNEMKVFRYVPGDSTTLAESSITRIMESSDSLLWIGTKSGFSIYDPFRESLSNHRYDPEDSGSFPCDWVLSFCEDHRGYIWIGTNQGLVRSDREGRKFDHIPLKRNEIPFHQENLFRWVNNIAVDPRDSNRLFLATRGGMLLFDITTLKVIRDYNENPDHLYRCSALSLEGDSILWTGEWGTGLKRLNTETGLWRIFNPEGEEDLNILSIVPKNNDELWLGTVGSGLGVFNKKKRTFTFFRKDPGDQRTLLSNWVHGNIYKNDHELWVLTDEGICISDPLYHSFSLHEIPFPISSVFSFFSDPEDQRLYVTGIGCNGLYYRDKETGRWGVLGVDASLSSGKMNFFQMLRDRKGVLWVTSSDGLLYLDEQKQKLNRYLDRTGNSIVPGDTILFSILEDSRGNLWIGSRLDGIIRIDSTRDHFTIFRELPMNNGGTLKSHDFKVILEDRFGRIWFGHYGGVILFEPENGSFSTAINDTLQHMGIRNRVIWGIEADTSGRIYLSIDDEGLMRVEEKEKGSFEFRLFHLDHGLNDLNLFAMDRDPKGNIWIINEGIVRFNPYDETFEIYDTRNGLHYNKNWKDRIYVDEDGNLFLTAGRAFESRNIRDMKPQSGVKNLVIESVEINSEITPRGLEARNRGILLLDPGKNNLVISYKAICFTDNDQIKYRYMLEGYDEEWQYVGQENKARYINLPPGRYGFRVQVSHRGVWLPYERKIAITARPWFWTTSWFITLVVLAGLIFLYGIYRFRIRQIRKKEQLESGYQKKLAELEMQALRAQMNPHFIFNSLNSINNFILKNETESASDFLTKFSRLVRQVLHNSKDKLISLDEELMALRLYLELEQLRFEGRFDFEISSDRQIDAESILIPPLLLQPYVENAIWHGLMHKDGPGKVTITIEPDGQNLRFRIEDDGIGRKKAKEYQSSYGVKKQSMGMNITKNRIEMFNDVYNIQADIRVEDLYSDEGQACGTRIILHIPMIHRNQTKA